MTAISATFADFKLIKGRKVAQLVLEVPIEQANAALAALGGVPRSDAPQWVGVAPLDAEAAQKPAEKPKGGKLAQRAGILCGERAFWQFIYEKHGYGANSQDTAAWWVRSKCQVSSRSKLDHDVVAGKTFERIEAQYRNWRRS